MHIYDYIIIGSGLTGLAVATRLSQETDNVLLLEAEPFFGGANRPAYLQSQIIDNGLRFWPGSELSIKALTELENILSLKLIKEIKDNNPETYEASGFKSFVGFGDQPPAFYSEFSYFLNSKEIETNLPVHQIVSLLKENFKGEFVPRSHVTRFNFENLDENSKKDQRVTSITVNGAKTYQAQNYIFTGNVRDLSLIVPDEVLSLRAKTKLKKDTYWMAVCLDLYHEGLMTDKQNLFVLDGTTDDSIGPCVGRFLRGTDASVSENQKTHQISQWVSFIDLNTSEETENIGEVLKKMKRQIKRAFPEMSEAIKGERINMTSPLSAGELKLNSNGTLHKVENLWIASAAVNAQPNLLGSLLQAQMTLASLGFGDAPQIEVAEATAENSTAL